MENLIEKKIPVGCEITWPKDFPELKIIDDALRCGICYDYIKTCMVTPCAHSYCSICIRRSLLYKTACPSCFEETFETSLRNNRVLDRVIELFVTVRERLVKHLRIAALHFNCNEQLQSPSQPDTFTSQKSNVADSTPKRNFHKSSTSSAKGKLNLNAVSNTNNVSKKSDISKRLEDILAPPLTNESVSIEVDCLIPSGNELLKIPSVPPMFLQTKESQPKLVEVPTVPCPVCNVRIPDRNINAHLDNCLASVDQPPVKSPVKRKHKRNPLPKMVWSLMAEKDLRKKLKEFGLNTQGDKKTLISRLQRYILLFNSECDSDDPRPISEIIRQVEKEEKQAPSQNQQRLVLNSKSDPKKIEEENQKYIQENKDSFKKLIEAMKEREGRNIKPPIRSSNLIASDEECDVTIKENNKETLVQASTSKTFEESINLCDSDNSEGPSKSPILGSWLHDDKPLVNKTNPEFSGSVPNLTINKKPKCNKSIPKSDDSSSDESDQFITTQKSRDWKLRDECHSEEDREESKSRTPSPSCIVTNHSNDSDDSISILINENIENDELLHDNTETATNNANINSQLEDPDFVVDTEQFENENWSEEVFLPQRKSKRKHHSSVLTDPNQNPSPRRTRRRLNK